MKFPDNVFCAFKVFGVRKWQIAVLAGYGDYTLSRHLRFGFFDLDFNVRVSYYAAFALALENLKTIASYVKEDSAVIAAARKERRRSIMQTISESSEYEYLNCWSDWADTVLSPAPIDESAPDDSADN